MCSLENNALVIKVTLHFLKPGFHMIATIAVIAAITEKKKRLAIAAIVAITWKPLSSDRGDRSNNDRWDRTFSISAIVVPAISTIFFSAFGLFPFIHTADPLLSRKIFAITYFSQQKLTTIRAYFFGGARSKGFATLRNISELQSDAPKLLRNAFEISSSCLIYSFRERNNYHFWKK